MAVNHAQTPRTATAVQVAEAAPAAAASSETTSTHSPSGFIYGGTATRSLDGADRSELPDPGYGRPVEQHLD